MKKINSIIFCFALTLLSAMPIQTIKAGDILIQPDEGNSSYNPRTPKAPIRLPLSVFQNETDITLDFTYSVGVAQITVEDEFGGVVYQEALDTTLNPSLSIETSDWDGGNYKLKVSYGSINLSGVFSL